MPTIFASALASAFSAAATAAAAANQYLHQVIVLGEGPIAAINQIYIDNVPVTDARFAGLVYAEAFAGGDDQAACTTLIGKCPGWTTAHRLRGVAYLYIRLKYDQNVFHGLPTITCDVDGRTLYDPRTGLSAFSHNPALAIRDYLTNTRYGRGIPESAIDDASFIVAADLCDELVAVPGGTQARYTCDGVVNTDAAPLDNLGEMLTACRGLLIYTGGQYRLRLDVATAPSFAFTADNIVGNWSIRLPEKRNRANRVRATFFNPAREWQPDIALQDSPGYRAADNGILLEQQFALNFTADAYRAAQIAQQALKQSRKKTLVQFTATIAGLRCEVGDVVTITHATPGWEAKPFRVLRLGLLSSDEVEVTALEYDAGVYVLDDLDAIDDAPGTTLPDALEVAAPGVPEVADVLYETTGSAGVKAKAVLTWAAADDAFVADYLPEYRPSGGAWVSLPPTALLTSEVADLAPGFYEFRLRARNSLGKISPYGGTRTAELLGLAATPADPAGLYVVPHAGNAYATWPITSDLDVRLGGRAVFRHSPATAGATWGDGVVLDELPGGAVAATLPLLAGTYMVKFQDSGGNWSAGMASFVASEDWLNGWTVVATATEQPTFGGTKTDVAVVSSALQLDAAALIDGLADSVDAWPSLDTIGGIAATGSYAFTSTMDLTTVATRNFIAKIAALSFDTADLVDARTTDVDYWDDVDGDAVNDCDVTAYIRTTPDDPAGTPTWSDWRPWRVGDFNCRAAQFRLDFASGSRNHNIAVSTLEVRARTPV